MGISGIFRKNTGKYRDKNGKGVCFRLDKGKGPCYTIVENDRRCDMKILLGMSGGVDSTVAAYRLQGEGHTVCGVTLVMHEIGAAEVEKAAALAEGLGISHRVIDCRERFAAIVQSDFAARYAAGETPNPCILCNPTVKFAVLYETMQALGYDAIATGHYARMKDGQLYRAADRDKDQSYMLYRLTEAQRQMTLFPLGDSTKTESIALAEAQALYPKIPKDSMDICFLPDGDYAAYLERAHGMTAKAGVFQMPDGTVVGTHDGQWRYTIGQRKGLGIACGKPIYVIAKDAAANTVTVGASDALFARNAVIRECCWLCDLPETFTAMAKIRYSKSESPVTVRKLEGNRAALAFDIPQRAVTPGQSAVLYDGDRVLGGGILEAGAV